MRVGVDTARRPGRTSGHVSCLLGGDLSRIHPVFTGERGGVLSQEGMILLPSVPSPVCIMACICLPRRWRRDVNQIGDPSCPVRLGGYWYKGNRNEGGSKREDAADCRNLIHIIFDESPRVWWLPDVRQDRKWREQGRSVRRCSFGLFSLLSLLSADGGCLSWGGGLDSKRRRNAPACVRVGKIIRKLLKQDPEIQLTDV